MTLDHTDEQLVSLAMGGDNDAMETLFARYHPMIWCSARKFFIPGASREDALQEARIGFFKGIRDFRPDAGSTFSTFAGLAVLRQLITALKTAKRVKREVHNNASSLDGPVSDEPGSTTLGDLIADAKGPQPEHAAMRVALRDAIVDAVMTVGLSDLEASILLHRLQDCSYAEIAENVGKPVKTIDNGLQRINSKLIRRFRSSEFRELLDLATGA